MNRWPHIKHVAPKTVNVKLVIAGDGSGVSTIQGMIAEHDDEGLRYPGRISGAEKADVLLYSSLLLFPSIHVEGMPNTVLEATECGLAVLTTRVEGIDDFFVGDLMGAELAGDLTQEIVGLSRHWSMTMPALSRSPNTTIALQTSTSILKEW